MLVGDGDNNDVVVFDGVHQLVWECVEEAFANAAAFNTAGFRVCSYSQRGLSHVLFESTAESCVFELVNTNSVLQFLSSQLGKYDAHHSFPKISSIGTAFSLPSR